MPAQEKLNRDDQLVAYIAGLGITIVIIAFILMGLGTVDSGDALNFGVIPGIGIIVLGIAVWLFQVQPWKKFDDLTTPAFPGHHDHADDHDEEAAPAPTKKAEVKAEKEVAEVVKEDAKEEPAADDLTLIEGVGPKSAEALAAAGITTFAQVAKMSPEDLEQTIKDQEVRLVGSTETWPEQAQVAVSGDLIALSDLQARIKNVAEPAADDLTLIEGVGPKSAEALAAAGITTFAQVADMSPEDLEKTIKDQEVRLVGSTETWPEQAQVAASGDLTALSDLQARIKNVAEPAEDDLTLIEGIGPKSAEALKAAGIMTFAQVAKMSPEDLEQTIKDQEVRLVGSTETWPQQAELAAAGKLSDLEELQGRIKGGVLQDE